MFLTVCVLLSGSAVARGQCRIRVVGDQFFVGDDRIWINGANTPWDSWNDFGGRFDFSFWDQHFAALRENGVNATRVWITCNGAVGIFIDEDGHVTGAWPAHWRHLDSFFSIAEKHGVYIKATLMSFDHFQDYHPAYQRWRRWIMDISNIESYIDNYLIPFLDRYGENPYLWSIDLINEPDWVFENSKIDWGYIQEYLARAAVAIHQHSDVLVTVGIAVIKYSSDTCPGAQGNKVSDAALQAKVDDPRAYLDYYSIHYWPWQDRWFGVPHYMDPESYGLDSDRPAVIGESPALGSSRGSIAEDYLRAYENGWQGLMAWTSNGVDEHGSLDDIGQGTRSFRDLYRDLVFTEASW